MAQLQRRLYVISYDITDPKRLGRIHRYLKRRGLAVQYSVFVVHTHSVGLQRILDGIGQLLDEHTDDIRAYPLPARLDYVHLGRPLLPEGINLHGVAVPQDLFG